MAMAATPKLRQDLTVTPAQDAGILYFDVRDPRTGNVLRLYDIEWWVAERFDGVSSFEDLSRWTQDSLGFAPSRADLETYAQRLQALGLFDVLDARAAVRAYDGPVSSGALGLPGPVVIGAPSEAQSSLTPVVAGAMSQLSAVLTEPEPPVVAPVPALVGGVPMAIEPRERDRPSLRLSTISVPSTTDDVMGAPLQPAAEGPSAPPRIMPPVQLAPTEDEPVERRSTLMMPPMQTPAERARPEGASVEAAAPESVARVQLPPTSAVPIAPLESQPTTSPTSSEAVPVVLSEPERSTPLLSPSVPELRVVGPDPSAETPSYANGDSRPAPATAATAPLSAVAAASGEPIGNRGAAAALAIKSELATTKMAATTAISARVESPTEKTPTVDRTAVTARKDPPPVAADEEEVSQGGVGRWIALAIVLMALAVAVYFVLQLRSAPRTPVSVVRAQPHDVVRTAEASAVVRGGGSQVLRMEAGGLLASVVSEGAEVKAGVSLAVLQNHGKLQKEIADLRDRLGYYQRKLEQAKDRGESGSDAQAKVNEKQERLAAAEANLKNTELLAPRSGKVKRVLVKAGEVVTPGSEILELAERGATAELKAATAEGMTIGQELKLRGPSGVVSAKVAAVREEKAEGDAAKGARGSVTIQLELPEGLTLKAGDELRLIKGELPGVVELPDTAVVGGDSVYVVAQGKATRRKIEVLDHEGQQALVKGLQPGDEVIVGGASDLREGQLVQIQ